uniref:Uncharacterized protein n=1 Tax=viral metagenome TaxID=1070528 RepID=A0A6C0EAI4_9ZZZZ
MYNINKLRYFNNYIFNFLFKYVSFDIYLKIKMMKFPLGIFFNFLFFDQFLLNKIIINI